MVSQRAALQTEWYHDNQLSITFYTCVSFGKMEGEIDTEQFMEETVYGCYPKHRKSVPSGIGRDVNTY